MKTIYRVIDLRTGNPRFEADTVEACHKYVDDNCCFASTTIRKKTIRNQATKEATPAALPALKTRKHYINSRTGEDTASAALAMKWHRAGDDVQVNTFYNEPHKTGLANVVHVSAARVVIDYHEDENRDHCRRIAEELDEYAAGSVRRCPECGEIHARDWDEVGDVFRCPNCGEVSDVDAWDVLSVWDYLDDALDIEYRVSGRARDALRSVCVMIACGGPNIYIDTGSRAVELYWWGDQASYPISHAAADEIDEWAAELWACL